MSSIKDKDRKVTDGVRDVMRLCRYSVRTERPYCGRIKRFVFFQEVRVSISLSEYVLP
jgi:hypothetical protein